MFSLPSFWAAAARQSGRLDFSQLDAAQLTAAAAGRPCAAVRGALSPGALDALLARGPGLASPDPWVCIADPMYPRALRRVPYAPPVLFYRGQLDRLDAACIAIVGTRRCTQLGRRMARKLAGGVRDAGGVVVSGLAWGIDAAAHQAARGQTVAVLGQGLDTLSSRWRCDLVDEMLDRGGLLVSEFAPGLRGARWTFPQRNRVIAGLCRVTVVVEAGVKSGALHTARSALECGRDVLSVPHHPLVPEAAGVLGLLADGAGLVRDVQDVLDAAGLAVTPPVSDADAALLAALTPAASLDELAARGLGDATTLSVALGRLELTGRVRRLPGDRYTPSATAGGRPDFLP